MVADPHLREDDPFVSPHGGEGLTALTKFRRVLQRAQQLQPEFMMLLGDLHVDYENAAPFIFETQDTTPDGKPFSFRVEKMRFSKDKSTLVVNDSITLSGFTPQMFEYKLGNRSALDWIVESYRVKTDARSGLVSDPNRTDEPKFILDLIGKVATVSLETQRLIGELPEWK